MTIGITRSTHESFLNAPLTAGRVQFREQYAADTKKGPGLSSEAFELSGGAERDRTVGLLNAIQALSQLSYSPISGC